MPVILWKLPDTLKHELMNTSGRINCHCFDSYHKECFCILDTARRDLGYKTASCNDETSLMTSSGFKL